MTDLPRMFATLAWGFSPETWGAIGFSQEGVRNRLAEALRRDDGLVLTMGTTGDETPEALRGRLLGLHRLSSRPIPTAEMVEPSLWRRHLADNGGQPKWPFGLPIIAAEHFVGEPPLRAKVLPRLHDDNLHRKIASNVEELTSEEVAVVLALPRRQVAQIWSSRMADFSKNLLAKPPQGPPPSPGQRILSPSSGPAATYVFQLAGPAARQVAARVADWKAKHTIFKIGFSTDPTRRLSELNAYFPDESTLCWSRSWLQWHTDEINAWTLEQEVFRQLAPLKARWLKGEIYVTSEDTLRIAFSRANTAALRPAHPTSVTVGYEEARLTAI